MLVFNGVVGHSATNFQSATELARGTCRSLPSHALSTRPTPFAREPVERQCGVATTIAARRVQFDVALAGQQAGPGPDGGGFVPAVVPERASAALTAVDVPQVAPSQQDHEPLHALGFLRREQQMHMIGHLETGLQQASGISSRFFSNPVSTISGRLTIGLSVAVSHNLGHPAMEALVPDVATLCELAVIAARGGDTRAGLQLAQQAYRCARADGSNRSRMLALNAMALCQLTSGRNIESIGSAIDAFRIAQAEGDHRIALHALTTLLGASNHLYGTEQITLPMTGRALEMAHALADASLVARLHNSRAVAFNMLGRFDDCDTELALAMEAAGKTDRIMPPALTAANLAHATVMRVRKGARDPASLEKARSRIDDAFALALAGKSGEAQIRLWYCRGILHHDRGELDAAIAALNQSIGLAVALHHHSRIADARLELASVYDAGGDLSAAVTLLESAFQDAMPLRPCRQLELLAEQLASIHQRQGNAREAAYARGLAETEHMIYEQERATASRELEYFWREVDQFWQARSGRA